MALETYTITLKPEIDPEVLRLAVRETFRGYGYWAYDTVERALRHRGVRDGVTEAAADESIDPILPAADDLPRAADPGGGSPDGGRTH